MEVLSYEFCSKIIKQYSAEDLKLMSYKIQPANSSMVGFLGEYFRLEAIVSTPDKMKKIKFFIKTIPPKTSSLAGYITESGLFKKEGLILEHLVPKLLELSSTPWTAKCYYSGDIIVLEDLVFHKYGLIDVPYYDYQHALAVIRTLARIHASSIAFEHIHGKNSILNEYNEMLFETRFVTDQNNPRYRFIQAGRFGVLELLKLMPEFKPELEDKYHKLVDKVSEFTKPSKKYVNTFTHGDLWNNNIMFKDETDGNSSCLFIDFQISRYTVPVSDLIIVTYLTTNKEFRDMHLKNLLLLYYQTMQQEVQNFGIDLKTIFTMGELEETWNIYKPAYLIDCVFHATSTSLGQKFKKSLSENDVFEKFILTDRRDVFRDAFQNDLVYRKKICDILLELINVL